MSQPGSKLVTQLQFSGLKPFAGGAFLLALIYVIEYYTGVSSSVGYVLTVLLIFWFSWNNRSIIWIGVIATLMILVGFFMIHNSMDAAIAVNRSLAVVTIWIAIFFVSRYRKLAEGRDIQKRQLEALFVNATEGILFTNSLGDIVRINTAAEKIFGYEPGELLGRKIETLIPERFLDVHQLKRGTLFHTPSLRPKGVGRELPGCRKNGEDFDTEISLSFFYDGDQVFYIAFIVDISERKRQERIIEENVRKVSLLNAALDEKVRCRTSELEAALVKLESSNRELTKEIFERTRVEERLLKSQQLHSAIARNFPEGVIAVVNRDLRYVLADGQELKNLGFATADPSGGRLFGPENIAATVKAEAKLVQALTGEAVSFDIALKRRVYNLIAVPLPDPKGNINELLVVMKNITERNMAERKLVRTIEKEKELSALKSRFVTMASHEFRTPLTTMLSSVFLLQNYTGERYEKQKEMHLERIKRSIHSLTDLMNDFLSIGSLEEGQIKVNYSTVEIYGFMKEVVSELNTLRKPGQEIVLSFPGEYLSLTMDRQILTNILRNLVSNAVKYSEPNARICIDVAVDAHSLVIAVKDHGMGIPEHEQDEIFKRFYRAENATNIQGTGLGLNIVKKYVNLLNGTIAFESKLNEGTTFTLKLPVKIEETHTWPN